MDIEINSAKQELSSKSYTTHKETVIYSKLKSKNTSESSDKIFVHDQYLNSYSFYLFNNRILIRFINLIVACGFLPKK